MPPVAAWLFNLAYIVLLIVLSPWLCWNYWRRGKSWVTLWHRLRGDAPLRSASDRPCIWFHAVSVGEVAALKTLIEALPQRLPHLDILISVTTDTGFQVAKQRFPQWPVFYSPLDFRWSVRRAIQNVRPDVIVFCELEVWPNWILAASRLGVLTAVVNGRLSVRSATGYRRLQWVLAPIFRRFTAVACQTEGDAQRFQAVGVPPHVLTVTGSMKFDGAETDPQNRQSESFRQLAQIPPESVTFLAGSTSEPEEELAIASFQDLANQFPQLRLIVVPRHPERFDQVAGWIAASGFEWSRRSQLDRGARRPWRILLVDTLGELGGWWGVCDIAYVGGSMGPREGQNMIEPAAYGAAVCFGPRTKNFRDVVQQLLDQQAAEVVHDQASLTDFLRRCLTHEMYRQQIGRTAQQIVIRSQGATERSAAIMEQLIGTHPRWRQLPTGPPAPYTGGLGRQRTGLRRG